MNILERILRFRQFFLYAVIGLGGVAIDYLIYVTLVKMDMHYVFANAISTTIAILFSFYINRKYNFKATDHLKLRFISFFTVGLLGLTLSTILLKLFVTGFNMDPLIAKLATLVFILLFQYTLNRTITFGDIMSVIAWIKRNKYLFIIAGALAIGYMVPLVMHSVVDEYDNFLGGKHIVEFGSWPYHDFFSHHMIMPYIFGAFFYLFGGDNTYLLRLGFFALSATVILGNAFLLRQYAGKVAATSFGLLFSVSILFLGMERFLSENLATLFLISSMNLLMYVVLAKKQLRYRFIGLLSVLLTLTALTTLNYIYVIGVISAFIIWTTARDYWTGKDIKQAIIRLAILGSAPILALSILAATHTLRPMVKDAILFNTESYAKYAPALGSGPIDTFFGALGANIGYIVDAVREPLNQTGPFSLMLCFTIILAIIVLRKNIALLITLLAALMLANTRIDDGINEPTSYHMVLMRMLTLLLLAFLIPHAIRIFQARQNTKNTTPIQWLELGLVLALGWSVLTYTLTTLNVTFKAVSEFSLPADTPNRMASLRDTERRSKDAAAAMQAVIDRDPQHAGYFIGPLNFGPELKMNTKQATRYTFWLPWSADCARCTKEFIAQLEANKPSVILWEPNFVIMHANTDEHTPQFMEFLKNNYYIDRNYPTETGNNRIFIRNDLRIKNEEK